MFNRARICNFICNFKLKHKLFSPLFSRYMGFPCGSDGKESTCNAGDLGSVPGLGRSPREGDGNPLQYSGMENSMGYTVHGVAKSRIQMSNFHFLGIWNTFKINLCNDSTDLSNLNSVVLKVQSASHGCYWSTANV